MSLLYLGSAGTANYSYVYNTDGSLLTGFDLPPGASEGISAYTLCSQVGAPDGTVYVAATLAGQAYVLQVNPTSGQILTCIVLTGITTLLTGYTVALLPNNHVLVVCTSASTVLKEFDRTGAVVQTYSLTAGTVGSIGLGSDGRTLYYVIHGTTTLAKWDLITDTTLPTFGDLGTTFQGQFAVLPDDRILALYLTSRPILKLLNTDTSVSVVYTPASSANGTTGGMAFDVSTQRVYLSCSNNGDASGLLVAFDVQGGAPLWSSTVTLHSTANLVGRVVLTPPNGSPRAYPVGDTVTEQIYRQRTAPWLTKGQVRLFFNDFQLDCATGFLPQDGISATCAIQHTDDGQTFSALEWIPYGEVGEYLFRVRLGQPDGQARQRAYRVTMTSAVPVQWLRGLIDVTEGTS